MSTLTAGEAEAGGEPLAAEIGQPAAAFE